MRRYKCHKEVSGFKIVEISRQDSRGVIYLRGDEDSVGVDSAFMGKHKPEVDGYYVLYADGYESYSPAKAFESGYDVIGEFGKQSTTLGYFRQTRSGLLVIQQKNPSRALSVAVTNLETALLWFEKHRFETGDPVVEASE